MKIEHGELSKKVRDTLPARAQRMYVETLRRAVKAASTRREAEKMAWEAVGRKYGPRPGMKLWVRHDWRRTATRRPGDTTAASSNQRKLAKVERSRKQVASRRTGRVHSATTVRDLRGRTIERSHLGRLAARGKGARPPKVWGNKAAPVKVGTVSAGNGPAKAKRIARERTLGEAPRLRKGLPRRRAVARRA